MPTINQLLKIKRLRKVRKKKAVTLGGCPQKKVYA